MFETNKISSRGKRKQSLLIPNKTKKKIKNWKTRPPVINFVLSVSSRFIFAGDGMYIIVIY